MKQKRMMTSLVSLTLVITLQAQVKAIRVESPLVTEKDSAWYVEQKDAWKNIVQKNPQNEQAWLNYYNAARYMAWFGQKDTLAQQVVGEMEKAIPESYTFNYCAYRESISGRGYGDVHLYAEAALAKLPDDMQFFDYDNWVCYLAMQGDEQRMSQMAKKYFNSGIYSEAVLRYNYNELAGMDEGSVFIANGDAVVIPKWLIQEGMNEHRDKTVVCVSFLVVKEYREWLFRKLGLVLPALKDPQTAEDYDANERAMLQAIIDHYGNKVYFSSTTPPEIMEPWKQNLYNEGLTLKYSKKPYDNMAVKRRNVEERYMLEYLLVPFRPEWTAGQRMSANYAVVLADLLPYYSKHDKNRYNWLKRLLENGVKNTSLDEERKQDILKLLM